MAAILETTRYYEQDNHTLNFIIRENVACEQYPWRVVPTRP
jgi:hypothetical protein